MTEAQRVVVRRPAPGRFVAGAAVGAAVARPNYYAPYPYPYPYPYNG